MTDVNVLAGERTTLQDRNATLRSQASAANRALTAEEQAAVTRDEARIAQINAELGDVAGYPAGYPASGPGYPSLQPGEPYGPPYGPAGNPMSITPAVDTLAGGDLGRFTVIGAGLPSTPAMLSISGLPVGTKAVFSPNPSTGRADLAIHVIPGTVSGSYEFTVTGVWGPVSYSAKATLVI